MIIFLYLMAFQNETVSPPENRDVILWQTLREGMNANEVATILRDVDGVKNVRVKTSRRGDSVSISYTSNGIEVAGLPYRVFPNFEAGRLASIRLETEACLGLSTEKYKNIKELLAQKYGDGRSQRERSEENQLVAVRDVFSATPTRVLLRLEPGSVPQHIYGATGIAGALAAIANASADADIEACPNDRGQKATIQVTYSNNANSTAVDAAAALERERRRERDKGNL